MSTSTDPFGPVGTPPTFQEPSDYAIGQHVVYHHFDGKDYEGVITDVYSPGSDVANRWAVHIDVGTIGQLRNITQASREDTQPEGTFSLKPKADPLTKDDDLVKNEKAGVVLPTRADENPRPQEVEREETGPRGGSKTRVVNPGDEPLRADDFDWSAAPSDAPEEPLQTSPEEEIRDDQIHNEEDAENKGDPGLDTPANMITDNRIETGEPLEQPSTDPTGTTKSVDDEHVVDKGSKKK